MLARDLLVLSLVTPFLTFARLSATAWLISGDDESDAMSLRYDIARLGLSQHDQDGVFGDLSSLRRNPHFACHSAIASRLRASCSNVQDGRVGLNEGERSGIAISFTLCSMHSALQQTPTECYPWSTSAPVGSVPTTVEKSWFWRRSSEDTHEEEVEQRAKCLGALHRSPQDWSTYNGYLSDATQLCFALNGERQADLAHRTYVNATMEKLALITLLKHDEESRKAESEKLTSKLNERLEDFRITSDHFHTALHDLSHYRHEHSAVLVDMRNVVSELEEGAVGMWQRVQMDSKQIASNLVRNIESMLLASREQWANELSLSLRGVVDEHADGLRTRLSTVDDLLGYTISTSEDRVTCLFDLLSQRMATLDDGFDGLSTSVTKAQSETERMSDMMAELHPLMQSSVDSAVHLKKFHDDLAASTKVANLQSRSLIAEFNRSSVMISESLNGTLRTFFEWQTSLKGSSPWWQFKSPGSIISAPSVISPAWLNGMTSHQHLTILFHGIAKIVEIMWQAVLLGVYGLISVMASLWLLLRTRLWRVMSRLSRGLWQELRNLLDGPADNERPAPPKCPTCPPIYASVVSDPGAIQPIYPWAKLRLFENDIVPDIKSRKTRARRSQGTAQRTHWVDVRRRAASEPP